MNPQTRKSRIGAAVFIIIALVVFVSARASGQAAYGTVIGTVTDPSGAAIVNATVTATSIEKGVAYTATTNASGYYTLPNLTPGNYKVSIASQGFKTFLQTSLPVVVGTSTTLNATLQVGEMTQSVTVTSAPPLIETDRPGVSTSLDSQQIESLPVANRNFTSLELLIPGATINWFQHGQTENPQGGLQIDSNGQLFDGTNFMIDGMDNTDPVLGIIMINPPLDAVQEFKVTTSNFDPEFSQAAGGVIQVEEESGGNQIHGSAFEFLQNDIFKARDPFTQLSGLPELRWNQFGGSAGGPLLKNKLFYFGDYQGTRQRNGGSAQVFVPTAAERSGDLSAFGVPIYDPTTGNPDGTGRTQFVSFPTGASANSLCTNTSGCLNMIPTSRISTQATNVLGLLPPPTPNFTPLNAASPNFITSGVQQFDTNQFDLRVDHQVNSKFHYFGHYSYGGYLVNTPGVFQLAGGPQFNGFQFEGISHGRNQNAVGRLSYVASPTLLGEFGFGVTRYRVFVSAPDESQQLANTVGIPGLNFANRPDTWGLPDLFINSTGGFQAGYQCNCPLDEEETEYQGVSNWTKLWGNHTLTWGTDIRRRQNKRLPSDQHRAGVYNFNTGVTALDTAGGPAGGLGLASFLLGDPSSFNRFAQISTTQQDYQWSMYYYAGDAWRISPKLTLTYGLRWDTWFADASLNAGQLNSSAGGRYDVTTNTVFIPGVGGVSKSGGVNTQFGNFSPRIGIAYSINPRTVVRTGWGRSYFQGNFGWTFNDLAADIYPSIVSQSLQAPSSFFPVEFATGAAASDPSLGTAPPAPVFPTIPSSGQFPLPLGISTPNIPTNQKIPYVDSWNLTVERQVYPDATLSLGYIGNVGRWLNGGWNLNAPAPGPGSNTSRQPLFAKFGLTQDIFNKCDCESSGYNALQARFNKRFSQNYSLLASYTWSKTLNFGEWGTPTDQYNYRLDLGPAEFDRASVFTLAHIVRLPFGHGQRWFSDASGVMNNFIGGWEWTGTTSLQSGLPFSPGISSASLNSFDMGLRPNQTGDPLKGGCQNPSNPTGPLIPVRTAGCWFNPQAYTPPAAFLFGNAGRNSLRGPGFVEADWALDKNFAIRERMNLQFRWEVFNAFNRTNLALPGSDVTNCNATNIASSNPCTFVPSLINDITSPMRNMQFGLHLTW